MSDFRFLNSNFPAFYEKFPSSSSIHSGFRHKSGLQEWITTNLASYPEAEWVAVTYPMKQFHHGAANRDRVSKVIRDHLRLLNIRFYGNAHKRFGRTLGCVPSIERGKIFDEWHFHLLLEIPAAYHGREITFAGELQYIWGLSGWALGKIDVQPCDSFDRVTGWSNYITKTTWLIDDAIDYNNVYWPNPPQPSRISRKSQKTKYKLN